MALSPGSRVGAYEISGLIGQGGMGEVYRARDTRLQRDVALKVLPDSFVADPERAARFEREAQALAALNHPNIAQIYGIEESGVAGAASGVRALVMELVEGDDLSTRIGRGALPHADALPIVRQIALALEAAHAANIIHRDLKPANVKITADGVVKVLDFGLAKAMVGDGSRPEALATMTSPAVTQHGVILGTAAYMSPEQARGRLVDKRADIWAFGCVLFELLTGRRAFTGDNVTDVLAAVVTKDPDWSRLPGTTPRSIRRLLGRCLQKDPKQRLHDIADARLELDAPMEDGSAADAAGAPPAGPHAARWSTRALLAAAALALAAGAALGFAWREWRETPPVEWTSARLGGPEMAARPRLSPDGHLLAFMASFEGLSQVSVMKPGTGVWTQLTRDRAHGLTFTMCWSSDGSLIYYDRNTDAPNGIYSVPALGGEERLVIENATYPAALADGSLLFGRPNADRLIQLHRFWPASGKLEPLPVDLPRDHAGPVRALDASRVVVVGRALQATTERHSPRIFDLATHELRPLGAVPSSDVWGLAVDPRDRSAVIALNIGSSFRLVRVTTDGRGTSTPLLTLLANPDFDVGPDGSLYVGLEDRPTEVLLFAASGANPERVTAHGMLEGGLAPLPDGRALLVSRIGSGPRVVVGAPGREPVKLVETGEDTQGPMTAVGPDRAALLIGSGATLDIGIVATNTGRILKRIKAPVMPTNLGASADGLTLYVSAGGSISAIAIDTGDTRRVAGGDSFAVDPDSGDLIVKVDERSGYRLVRVPPKGGTPTPVAMEGDLRMIPRPLAAGSIRNGRLVLPVASADSMYWYVAELDLATGVVKKVNVRPDLDFHFVTWASDGRIIGFGLGMNAALWKFSR